MLPLAGKAHKLITSVLKSILHNMVGPCGEDGLCETEKVTKLDRGE